MTARFVQPFSLHESVNFYKLAKNSNNNMGINMDQIFNDPIIAHFLKTVKEKDKISVLRQLIVLGIHAVSSKIHEHENKSHCGCGCVKVCHNFHNETQMKNQSSSNCLNSYDLVQEIEQIKKKLNQLAANANCTFKQDRNSAQSKERQIRNTQSGNEKIENEVLTDLGQNGIRMQFRHHLDDSEVRKVLSNPYAKASPKKKQRPKEEVQKMHKIQKQLDEKQIQIIRQKCEKTNIQLGDETGNIGNGKNNTVESAKKIFGKGNSFGEQYRYQEPIQIKKKNKSLMSAKSKIKSLVKKDKQRRRKGESSRKQVNENEGKYCLFQYSDEEGTEEIQIKEKTSCPIHSRFQADERESEESSQNALNSRNAFKQSYKKERKKMKQNLQIQFMNGQDESQDEVSQSSSFSKFSMGSQREAGKISGFKK